MTNFDKFYKKYLSESEDLEQFIEFLEFQLWGKKARQEIRKFMVHIAWKHEEGIDVIVFARNHREAEVMALNTPEGSAMAKKSEWDLPSIYSKTC